MNIDQIAAEAATKIMEKQMHRGLIFDVAYTIIKAAIAEAYAEGYMECLNRMEQECYAVESRTAQASEK